MLRKGDRRALGWGALPQADGERALLGGRRAGGGLLTRRWLLTELVDLRILCLGAHGELTHFLRQPPRNCLLFVFVAN